MFWPCLLRHSEFHPAKYCRWCKNDDQNYWQSRGWDYCWGSFSAISDVAIKEIPFGTFTSTFAILVWGAFLKDISLTAVLTGFAAFHSMAIGVGLCFFTLDTFYLSMTCDRWATLNVQPETLRAVWARSAFYEFTAAIYYPKVFSQWTWGLTFYYRCHHPDKKQTFNGFLKWKI